MGICCVEKKELIFEREVSDVKRFFGTYHKPEAKSKTFGEGFYDIKVIIDVFANVYDFR